jgi:hypothetical protein
MIERELDADPLALAAGKKYTAVANQCFQALALGTDHRFQAGKA